MKKFLVFAVCSLAAAPLLTASTCVSRVDKNLDKTTAEKIDFCLTEEEVISDETPATEVIYSDTQNVQYPKKKNKRKHQASAKQQTTKVYTTSPVSLEYFNRNEYPAFRNDTLPSVNAESAHETALEALRGEKKPAKKAAQKPKRKLKKQKAAPVVPPSAEPLPAPKPKSAIRCATINCSATAETPVVTPLSTPSAEDNAEVAQAQALQNDPLSSDNTLDGTVPAGFLDDGVMGADNFGYNATDPAFQP